VPEIARMAGITKSTVYKWIARYERHGIDGLSDRASTGRPLEISGETKGRILALTRCSPPEKTGLSHWSSREMARYLKRAVRWRAISKERSCRLVPAPVTG